MAANSGSLSVDRAWNTVTLEERIQLVSKAQAQGLTAGVVFALFMGCIGYGFDEISLLPVGVAGALLIIPLFSSQRWRKEKPELILRYLAARSVARRYAYGCNITDLDIKLIFQGVCKPIYDSEEDAFDRKMAGNVEMDESLDDEKEVWICLMEGGIVVMSERPGGAKLEFSAAFVPEFVIEPPDGIQDAPRFSTVVHGNGLSRGKKALLWSSSLGAMYVFERKVTEIVENNLKERKRLIDQIAQKAAH